MFRGAIAGSDGSCMFSFLRKCQTVPRWLYHFTFPSAVYQWSSFPTSLPACGVVFFILYTSSGRGAVISHCGSVRHFLMANDLEHLAMCLFVISMSPSVQCLYFYFQFFSWIVLVFSFWLLRFESSLYTLDARPLWDLWFGNIFFQSVACPCILLTRFFTEQSFLIFMKSSSSVFPLKGCVFEGLV